MRSLIYCCAAASTVVRGDEWAVVLRSSNAFSYVVAVAAAALSGRRRSQYFSGWKHAEFPMGEACALEQSRLTLKNPKKAK